MSKILVIEDDTTLREGLVDWLTFAGYEVLSAEDGLVGITKATLHLPDVIICDIMMPRRNGLEVLATIQAEKATVDIPFIFMSARVEPDDITEGIALGANAYITKPFTHQELLCAIEQCLG